MVANYAGWPVPSDADAPAWPAFMASLTSMAQTNLVQQVASQAERDSRLADAPAGLFVMCTADGTCWYRTTSTWITLFTPPGPWQTVALAPGYSVGNVDCQIRTVTVGGARFAAMRGRFTADSGSLTGSLKVGTVPANCVPAERATTAVGISTTGPGVSSTCRLEVGPSSGWSGLDAGPGAITVWITQGETSTSWCDLSIFYPLD